MYTVQMEQECACFKRSEYTNNKSFENQQDAYNYTNILAEFMNEDFCSRHKFVGQRVSDTEYVIRVNDNGGGGCGTGGSSESASASSCSSGSCGCE